MKKQTWDSYWTRTDQSMIERYIQLYKARTGYPKLVAPIPMLDKKGCALEVGAGKAWISRHLLSLGWKTHAMDLNQNIAQQNRAVVDNYIVGDIFELPYKDQSFDLVTSCGLLEHFDIDIVKIIVSEMRRVGKNVVNWIPTCTTSWQLFWKFRNILGGDVYTKSYVHTEDVLRDVFESCGFTDIQIKPVRFANLFTYLYIYAR